MAWRSIALALAAVFLQSAHGQAAQPSKPSQTKAGTPPAVAAQQPGEMVLRTYVNLVQIPALILSTSHKPMPTIPPSLFRISIDYGKPFLPRHVRREGDDPIHVAILVDRSGYTMDLLPAMAASLASLTSLSLRPDDRISLAVLSGCTITRTAVQDPTHAQQDGSFAAALLGTVPPKGKPTPYQKDCAAHPRLWNAAVDTLRQFQEVNSRRVLLLVTDGVDTAPTDTLWPALREQASQLGVAIFGIRSRDFRSDSTVAGTQPVGHANIPIHTAEDMDTLSSLAESSGGLVLGARRFDLRQTLATVVNLVRDRYIVEFPRPMMDSGHHRIDISVGKRVFVTTAAVSVSLPDPKETADDEFRIPSADENFTVDAPGPQLQRHGAPAVPGDKPDGAKR